VDDFVYILRTDILTPWRMIMTIEPEQQSAITSEDPEHPLVNGSQVSLLSLISTFFRLGLTVFGGMWAATQKLENELVRRKGWLTKEELQALLVAATIVPAPRFLSLGGLIGFRLRGWAGGFISIFSLIAPAALLVLVGVIVLTPELLGEPMVPLQRAVGIAVVGLLFGNAYHQLKGAKVKGRQRVIGLLLGLAVFASAALGVPLIVSAIVGFTAGAFLIRKDKEAEKQS
jgi:chromate transporter